jgi:hypothetical protein
MGCVGYGMKIRKEDMVGIMTDVSSECHIPNSGGEGIPLKS